VIARASLTLTALLVACSNPPPPETVKVATWQVVHQNLPGALLSVWGTSGKDVWSVGGDARDGSGPLMIHFDGTSWKRMPTGLTAGDLWWVFGFAGGPVFAGGGGGTIVRCQSGACTKMTTPGTDTVFGLWGSSPTDMWAVGGNADTRGFAWRLKGDAWVAEPSLPADVVMTASIWKVFGRSANDAWLVGAKGISFHWNGTTLEKGPTGVGSSLFTVHASKSRYAAVGGDVSGVVVENDGSGWKFALNPATYGLTGVALTDGDIGYAVGQYASVYARDSKGWREEDTKLSIRNDLHGVWIDPDGAVWAVGGKTASFPLTEGVLIRKGLVEVPAGGLGK
jgi:hypothetical protein